MPDGPVSPDIRSGEPKQNQPDIFAEPKFIPERLRQQDPTEASKGFLRRFTDRLFTDRPGTAQGPLQAIFAVSFAKLAVQDFMQGNYPLAAAEGVIAGVLAISPARFASRLIGNEFRKG